MNELKDPAEDGKSNRFIPVEQRETAGEPRRIIEERRQEETSIDDGEKRDVPERRETEDRRKMGLKVPCKTSGTIDAVEDWLDEHCDNDCRVVLQKVSEDRSIKHRMVVFETDADRDRFLDKHLKRNE